MRVRLKGVNRVSKRLADGSSVTYYYAWKGGPRLPGKPGAPEFIAAYNAAVAERLQPPPGTLSSVLRAYQDAPKFQDLALRTRRDYAKHIAKIEEDFGDFPIAALSDRRTRGEFMNWRDRLAAKSRRQADYAFAVLALILAWAYDRGAVPANPCERPGKLYRSTRVDNIWTAEDEAAFLKVAPPHIGLAFMLAIWTGQRQGDLLRLTWKAYNGSTIRLRQRKGNVPVEVPVGAPLRAILEATKREAVTILSTTRGTSWTESGFRASWRKACEAAGVEDLTFHDLRGSAVTRLAVAGAQVPQIAAVTGHDLKRVETIMRDHYLGRDSALAATAIRLLEAYEGRTKIPN
ncbi:tyrosine-type recombinase/integrase [Wenxinia marina]|uniref:Phage integrase family n=1 Tax=Wenxinia marina DSM 24838 TaxID=1123501 RepID=A0A0D0QHK5_9RHOB|nr:tyrosine-type recombinase/integrase [Wenxinia marina]KIQ70563.1 Phage integrase family [Wenxinia marina DSM 24838]GGL52132.1 integrase [Wenxinia marina]